MSMQPPQDPNQPYVPIAPPGQGHQQHQHQQHQQPQSQYAQQIAKKKPWLPLKHIIGLCVVAAFTLSGVGGTLGVNNWLTAQSKEASPWMHPDYDADVYTELSKALRSGDRDAFLYWGEGEGAEQLARLWDETLRIGWTTGYVEGSNYRLDPELENEPTEQPNFTIGFDLGITNERLPNEEASDAGGILVYSFDYDIELVESEEGSKRITEIRPKTPMPWDDEAGVAVAKAENVVLFGFAHEQGALDANIAEAQFGAQGVLDTGYAEEGGLNLRGFTGMIATDRAQYLSAVYGEEQSQAGAEREWHEAGLAKTYPVPIGISVELPDIYTGFSGAGGTMVFFDSTGIGEGMARTAAHEFAHALHRGVVPLDMSLFDAPDSAERVVTEGFARYVEDRVVSSRDGYKSNMRPEVLQAVASSASVNSLFSAAAFDGADTAGLAYDAAGNYFEFMTAKGASPVPILIDSYSYKTFDFEMWNIYMKSPTGDPLTTDAWQQWAAAQ